MSDPGYVGVVTGLSGRQAPAGESPAPGARGCARTCCSSACNYVNRKELRVDVLEIGVNQVSLLGDKGGEVITKAQIAPQNAAMEQLSRRMLDEQKEKRRDYAAQRSMQDKSAPAAAAPAKAGAVSPVRPPDATAP